jgi:hypothetical protein
MSRAGDLRELIGEIDGHAAVSRELLAAARTLVDDDIPRIGRNTTTSVAAAGLIENYYTALETVLFRVSQNFGNSLDAERWHSDLLHRMTLAVPDVRPAVITNETHEMLDELMRFRHFKRYYFQLRYDWHRLDHLLALVDRTEPRIRSELSALRRFLVELVSVIEAS